MSTALVLSGGGARGAYEAGVVAGLVDVRGRVAFDVFAGASVGAINATFLASWSHRPDLAAHELVRLWEQLRIGSYLRPARRPRSTRSVVDVRPFERVVQEGVSWPDLRRNLDAGALHALFIAALDVDTGRTTVFGDIGHTGHWSPSRDPRRHPVRAQVTWEHVLASAAIPAVFPPRRVRSKLYYDGGLRFNTPISPTLRAGADRLVVVSPLHRDLHPAVPSKEVEDVRPLFLAGKMLHAVLLDPFAYDLDVLARFNGLIDVLDATMAADERAAFDARCVELRGAPYRRIDTLVFSPSRDLGAMGLDFLRYHRRKLFREGLGGVLLAAAAPALVRSETDLASYLLFDGRYTTELIELGRRDVQARADEVRAFFA
ncbi:MAG: patatin-like phospholipase family protein [Myxococcales bacterium]|nr:patatin-like phospholipase family protein [Myxococcales bacterium]